MHWISVVIVHLNLSCLHLKPKKQPFQLLFAPVFSVSGHSNKPELS